MLSGRWFKGRIAPEPCGRKSDAYDALLGIGMATAASIFVTPELAVKCVPVS
jgi:hypothetical protein